MFNSYAARTQYHITFKNCINKNLFFLSNHNYLVTGSRKLIATDNWIIHCCVHSLTAVKQSEITLW